jgi:hypothetical protein
MKKCKNCGEKFEARFNTTERYCWSVDCKYIEAMDKLEKSKKKNQQDEKKRIQNVRESIETKQEIVKKLQAEFNKFIRNRDSDKNCISCGVTLRGKKFDAGHFWNANNHWAVRFDEDNVHGQCVRCNRHLHGNLLEYRTGLIQRIGNERYERLETMRNWKGDLSREELKELLKIYRQKNKIIKVVVY